MVYPFYLTPVVSRKGSKGSKGSRSL